MKAIKFKKGLFFFMCVIFLFIHTTRTYSQAWEQTSSFPGTPRDDASYFKIGNKHFVGTGREVGFGCTRNFYYFDENTLSWQSSAPLPLGEERQYAVACSWNDKGYFFGGVACSGAYKNDFWEYNPLTDAWTSLPNLPANGRAGMVQFILNDTLYIVGGRNSSGILNEVWTYNFITQTWNQKNNLPSDGIWRGIAFTFENNAYIGLGKNNLNNQTGHNTEILNYQPSTDSWIVMPTINWGTRSYVGYAQTDSLLFLFGGQSESNQILISTERVHLNDFTSDVLADFPSIARKGGVAFLVQNDLYFTTGISLDTRFNETWRLSGVASIDEREMSDVQIFPNPASESITIEISGGINTQKPCLLIDASGREMKTFNLSGIKTQIAISDLNSGIYFVKVGDWVEKLVVE